MVDRESNSMWAVVDGANVAYEERGKAGKPRMGNIMAIKRQLEERGYRTIIIVDASLRHEVDDPKQLEALEEQKVVRQAPAGTDADFFVLKAAEADDAIVVSNDTFGPYQQDFPWIKKRRVPYMIVKGEPHLYEQRLPNGE
jgi:hypothetical protein